MQSRAYAHTRAHVCVFRGTLPPCAPTGDASAFFPAPGDQARPGGDASCRKVLVGARSPRKNVWVALFNQLGSLIIEEVSLKLRFTQHNIGEDS